MKVKASGNIDRKRGYIYFKQLSFLRKVVKPTKRSNDKMSPNELEVLKNVLESEESVPQDDPLEDMETERSHKTFEEEFHDTSNTYNNLLGINEEHFNLASNFPTEAKSISNGHIPKIRAFGYVKSPQSYDYDTLFLLSLAQDFQKIPEERKLDVKIELMEVLKKAKKKIRRKRVELQQEQHQQQQMTIKDEAESESLEDIDEHSLDSIQDPTTPELLEEDNI